MESATDEKLVQIYLNGDEKALEELVRRYLPLIYNFSRRYSGDTDNASDIAQEVFIKVWKNLKKFDQNKSFKIWIFTIAKNTALDWLKLDWLKKKNAVPFSLLKEFNNNEKFLENILDLKQISIIDEIYQNSVSKNLALVIEKLPLKYENVINLHYDKGLNFREIAGFLKEPINTVKSRYRRGLIFLRNFLLKDK